MVSKKLSHELLNLDIDEGVLIESTKNTNKKMYINKRTSGFFVEICSDLTDMPEIRFYRDIIGYLFYFNLYQLWLIQ